MPKKKLTSVAKQIKETSADTADNIDMQNKGNFDILVSTGSTTLDLAISGGRVRGGGIPAGIIFEIFGPSQSGKTAILSEIAASTNSKGGDVLFLDPEARFDQEYARIYGYELKKDNYHRPDTVTEMFAKIKEWDTPNMNVINTIAADSLAAFSTELEMEKEDKRGQGRAKEFSAGLRKHCRIIAKNNWLIACSNQERIGSTGNITTPGGKGIPFYASVRIRIAPTFQNSKIEKTRTVFKKAIKKVVGIQCECEVRKSVDDPFRQAIVFIMFGHGVDDVRGNLAYIKDITGASKYDAVDKEYATMDSAIAYIEDNNYEAQLREKVIDLWEEVQEAFKIKRKKKVRF